MSVQFVEFLKRKPLRITIIAIVLGILLLGIAHPLLSSLMLTSMEYSGITLYEDETYLKYEKGHVFQKALSGLSFVTKSTATAFTYKNSVLRDSWFNGKFPDAFMLELSLGDNYELAKEEVCAKYYYMIELAPEFDLYYIGDPSDKDCFCVALYEESSTAICVLLTDCHYTSADGVLIRHFPLPGM